MGTGMRKRRRGMGEGNKGGLYKNLRIGSKVRMGMNEWDQQVADGVGV